MGGKLFKKWCGRGGFSGTVQPFSGLAKCRYMRKRPHDQCINLKPFTKNEGPESMVQCVLPGRVNVCDYEAEELVRAHQGSREVLAESRKNTNDSISIHTTHV